MFEVEQKFYVEEVVGLLGAFDRQDIQLGDAATQIDIYFAHPCRDFSETDEALRLRTESDRSCLTYKGPKVDATTKTRREVEILLPAESTSQKRTREIFALLGFSEVLRVEKTRRIGHARVEGYDVDIALDDVRHLGLFVELEVLVDERNLDGARGAVAELARRLGLDRSERRSYLELRLAESDSQP